MIANSGAKEYTEAGKMKRNADKINILPIVRSPHQSNFSWNGVNKNPTTLDFHCFEVLPNFFPILIFFGTLQKLHPELC